MHKILLDNLKTWVNQPLLPILPWVLESPCVAMPWSCNFLNNSRISMHTLKCIDSIMHILSKNKTPLVNIMEKKLREASTPTKLQPKHNEFEKTKLQQHEDPTNGEKKKTKKPKA